MVIKQSFQSIDLTGIKGVLIDLDNTLYKHDPCHNQGLQACHHAFSCGLSTDEWMRAYQTGRERVQKRLYPGGSCRSRLLYFQAMFEYLKKEKAYERALLCEETYIQAFCSSMQVDVSALLFLKRCKDAAIPVCLVTNLTMAFQVKKICGLGLQDYITYLVSSEEAGVEKPHIKIMQLALQKLNVAKDQVIMIGDEVSTDIKGADSLGVKGIKVTYK